MEPLRTVRSRAVPILICFQQGILPVVADKATVERLGGELTVDLAEQTITNGDGTVFRFDVNPLRKMCLLEGTDLVGLTLRHRDAIGAWQAHDRTARPWIWDLAR